MTLPTGLVAAPDRTGLATMCRQSRRRGSRPVGELLLDG